MSHTEQDGLTLLEHRIASSDFVFAGTPFIFLLADDSRALFPIPSVFLAIEFSLEVHVSPVREKFGENTL